MGSTRFREQSSRCRGENIVRQSGYVPSTDRTVENSAALERILQVILNRDPVSVLSDYLKAPPGAYHC